MDLVSYALVTLDNTKTFLGITNNEKDELLKMLINMATDYIESQTGRRFTSAVNTNEKIDGTGTSQIKLKRFPIITPPEVLLYVNDTADNTDSWTAIDSNDFWVDTETGIITRTSSFLEFDESVENDEALSETVFTRGKEKYKATYTSGYSTVPYDIQFACMSMVGNLLATGKATGIKSESLGDHSITYQDVSDIGSQSMFSDVINKYRDIPLA